MKIAEKIQQHLKVLCEDIGARPTGSQANLAAVEYAYQEFKKYGLCVQQQSFDCMDWTYDSCSLTVCGKEFSVLRHHILLHVMYRVKWFV